VSNESSEVGHPSVTHPFVFLSAVSETIWSLNRVPLPGDVFPVRVEMIAAFLSVLSSVPFFPFPLEVVDASLFSFLPCFFTLEMNVVLQRRSFSPFLFETL